MLNRLPHRERRVQQCGDNAHTHLGPQPRGDSRQRPTPDGAISSSAFVPADDEPDAPIRVCGVYLRLNRKLIETRRVTNAHQTHVNLFHV
jgi:hypothetical protein